MIDVYKFLHGICSFDRPKLHLFLESGDTEDNSLKLAKKDVD